MLKISAQSEYAMILVRHLLKTTDIRKLSEISLETKINEPILRKISNKLENRGVITSMKGRNGGIILRKREISVYDLLEAMGEDLHVAICSGRTVCSKNDCCEISPVIANLQRGLDAVLKITKI